MSTINERNHRKNPPYKCCDKEIGYSDDDSWKYMINIK